MQILSSANTRSCPRDDIAYGQGSSFAEDMGSPRHNQFNTSLRCTLAATVVTHRSCCMSHNRVGTVEKKHFSPLPSSCQSPPGGLSALQGSPEQGRDQAAMSTQEDHPGEQADGAQDLEEAAVTAGRYR